MVLYSIEQDSLVSAFPDRARFEKWKAQLTAEEIISIQREFNRRMGTSELRIGGWLPAGNWAGTPFEPILRACDGDETMANRFFGLLIWEMLMKHPDTWAFGRVFRGEKNIEYLTYYRLGQDK